MGTSIWCGSCETFFHLKCVDGMTAEFIDTCEKMNKIHGGSSYLCFICRKIFGKINKSNIELEARMAKMEDRLRIAELEREAFKERIARMEAQSDQVKEKMVDVEKEMEAGMEKAITVISQDMAKEMKEREDRSGNIVVYGMEESKEEKREERDKEDEAKVRVMAREMGVEVKGEVAVKFRAGKMKEDGSPRPLIVSITDEETREKMMDQARFLARRDGWSRVYVQPDMTPKQRDEAKKQEDDLKKEAEEKTEEAKKEGKKGKYAVVGRRGQKRLMWWEERERRG